jgi:hypothetical protein
MDMYLMYPWDQYQIANSKVEAVDEMLQERCNIVQQLKKQLHKAQNKIKLFF